MADRAVPNLPSRDFTRTSAFYGSLGFRETYRDDSWLILRRGTVQLEFFPFPDLDPLASSFMCSIRVEELHAAVAASVPIDDGGIPRLTPVARQAWGQRAGYLVDLDGTQLALIEERGPDG
ncbi:MAG TPA: bleomycin resistance protein [Micrococcales bacterium]|uniref:bleomycin resistance protein n=1 Tax=Miniimonas arenae TaxID=676201 RepID=UPI000EC41853|nr:bleomycin resistance protein [Miniimonas arenae]HCX85944.1 bleomycin resistance protein [Micrococcales bacterium]